MRGVSQDHVSETNSKLQMVSADTKIATSSAGHGHKAAVAAAAGGAEIPKLTVVLAVNLGHAEGSQEAGKQQMANAASRTTTLYAKHGR